MIQDTGRFTMDLVAGLERTLRGKVKPSTLQQFGIGFLHGELINFYCLVITQCSIRHLYELKTESKTEKESLISLAKQMERRRCNHHTLEKPLSTLDCFTSVIDPKQSNTNKNRYVIASQEEEVRKYCRGLKGVPLVYVKRSVMVMEPMADGSVSVKQGIDRGKFRTGLRDKKAEARKRKREDDPSHGDGESADKLIAPGDNPEEEVERAIKKKRIRGPKGPNPLSVKKPKKRVEDVTTNSKAEKGGVVELSRSREQGAESQTFETIDIVERPLDQDQQSSHRKRRKRRHKTTLLTEPEAVDSASIEDG